MSIDLSSIGIVAGVGFVSAVGIVLVYTLGLRLLGTGQPVDVDGERTRDADETTRTGRTPAAARFGAGVCFTVCGAAVLYGIWLTVPQFH
ncbi:hypothetical protein [Curtobacterium sp. UCD-KPL2560]|uniref:hypothetical protein n=1 Tax=Curtobacterium sp. UCD-KPL2560 TaxID=1885315 RepID=UPI00082672CE|nr:hypothetical protein [Curtobacterium sp. UCD-KPL2560]